MKVVFTEQDQRTIAWAWQHGEEYAVEMSEGEVAALAAWLEGNAERIYAASGLPISPNSSAMALAARLRGMVE